MTQAKRFIPLAVLISGAVLFFALGGQQYLNLETLKDNYLQLQHWTHDYYFLSVLLFILAYIGIVAFSVPGATIMTLIGGFLFGVVLGGLWVVLAATTGATLTFLAVHTAFGELMKKRAGSGLNRITRGFNENAFNYLFVLRLVPVFPFFMINIAAGIVGMRLRSFVLATFFGIMPGSFVYAWVGSGLGYTLQQGKQINLGIIFQPQVLLPLLALGGLSLIPVILRRVRRARGTQQS